VNGSKSGSSRSTTKLLLTVSLFFSIFYRWALDTINTLASIAPNEPIVILRLIVDELNEDMKAKINSDSYQDTEKDAAWKDAIRKIKAEVGKAPMQMILRCFLLGCEYLAKVNRGGREAKKEADEDLKREGITTFKNAGLKLIKIAFAISPRNVFGLLLLPRLGLDATTVAALSEGKMFALIALLTLEQWDLKERQEIEEMGVKLDLIDGAVSVLIPTME
jgi:hypothetical protein